MRQIAINGDPAVFTKRDLPMVIHGKEGSGASLYAIIAAVSIYRDGDNLFFWSAHHMAKEEFSEEMVPGRNIHRIDSADEVSGRAPQVIIMENESPKALGLSLAKIDKTRVIFIKNFETLPEALRNKLLDRKLLMIAGDLESVITKEAIFKFETQIFFSPYPGVTLPTLGKYEGVIMNRGSTNVLF